MNIGRTTVQHKGSEHTVSMLGVVKGERVGEWAVASHSPIEQVVAIWSTSRDLVRSVVIDIRGDIRP